VPTDEFDDVLAAAQDGAPLAVAVLWRELGTVTAGSAL
jgi:hypothetical protein